MQPYPPASFAELLRRHRLAAGYSQKKLADKAKLSLRGVSDLERGARLRPHPDTVRMLARALGLTGSDQSAFFAAARAHARQASDDEPSFGSSSHTSGETYPHNVPAPMTRIVGRDREVSAVGELLARNDLRLVTLTGPGGVGKTRLALHIAMTMLDSFPDGVWVVRLAHLADPHLVLAAIAHVFGLKENSAAPIADVLRRYLREKRLLLVVDNFEHVAAAARDIADPLQVPARKSPYHQSDAPGLDRGTQLSAATITAP